MSIHKSLQPRDRLKRQRNVLSRRERIERLITEEKWSEGDSLFGLPKVKQVRVTRSHKKKAEEEAPAEAAEQAEGAPAAEE